MEIIIGKTAGFCYGVKRAIENTEKELENTEKLYCLGEIVHNSVVIDKLKKKGLKFIDNISDTKGKTIIRAHGVQKEVYEYVDKKSIEIEDYTCPKVTRIHDIVKEYVEKDYYIFLCGNKSHPENIGTISYCKEQSFNIEKIEDVYQALSTLYNSKLKKVLLIAQTTYSIKIFKEIQKKITEEINKSYKLQIENTICKATEVRQEETEKLAKTVDMMIIIGGKNSSNTKKLYEIAKRNLENSICIETYLELEEFELKTILKNKKIGIMAGASTPKESIDEVIKFIKSKE